MPVHGLSVKYLIVECQDVHSLTTLLTTAMMLYDGTDGMNIIKNKPQYHNS